MKNLSNLFLLSGLVLVWACSQPTKKEEETAATYSNPIDVEFGDPYILDNGDGTYYMYGTGGGAKDGFATYSSTDLINWKFEGQVYTGNTDMLQSKNEVLHVRNTRGIVGETKG